MSVPKESSTGRLSVASSALYASNVVSKSTQVQGKGTQTPTPHGRSIKEFVELILKNKTTTHYIKIPSQALCHFILL
jgi:hypothetical protein